MAANGASSLHPSEALEFATVHSSVPGADEQPHPADALEFATVHSSVPGASSRPHPSEQLEFTTIHPSIGRVGSQSSIYPSLRRLGSLNSLGSRSSSSQIGRLGSQSTFSPSVGLDRIQSHPSEALEFATIASSSGLDGKNVSFDDQDFPCSPSSKFGASQVEYADRSSNDGSKRAHQEMFRKMSVAIPGLRRIIEESALATAAEKKMSIREGIRLYPKAIGWSVLLSMTLVMEGYDLSIINGFFAFPTFRKRYGSLTRKGTYQISTAWQSGLTNGAVVGEVLGLFFNGIVTEKIGYRKSLISALIFLCLAIFFAFFAFHVSMLMASEVICGLSWGVFQTLSTTYAAEVMPTTLRAYLTSNVNLCWLIGQVTGLSVLRGTVNWTNDWSFRVPFALQWMWALPILVGTYFAPESPWWFVRHARYEDAKKALLRLTTPSQSFNADETIALMQHTNEVEKYLTSGTSYWDCFKGVELRRTEIVCVVWMIQTLSGGPMTGYSAYFFTRAGLSPENAFDLSAGMYALAIIAHVIALFLMNYVGRRKLYMFGCASMCIALLAGGIVGTLPETKSTGWALGGLTVVMTFLYDLTIGPVCYTLVSEIPSTRLRVKTVVLGRVSYNIVGIISNILMPEMLNPEAWNLKGKTCFVWAFTALCSLVWCYYRLPEPKGLTYMELDILFQKRASARKFRKFRVQLAKSGYFELVERQDDDKHWEGVAG